MSFLFSLHLCQEAPSIRWHPVRTGLFDSVVSSPSCSFKFQKREKRKKVAEPGERTLENMSLLHNLVAI